MILYWRSVWSNDPVNCQFIVNKYLYLSFGGFDIRWFDATWHIKQGTDSINPYGVVWNLECTDYHAVIPQFLQAIP